MGITVGHNANPALIGRLAFDAGRSISSREDAVRAQELAASREMQQAQIEGQQEYIRQKMEAERTFQDQQATQASQMSHRQQQRAMQMAQEVNSIYKHADELTPEEQQQAMRIVAGRYADIPGDIQSSIFNNDRIPGVEEPKDPISALRWYDDPKSGQKIPFVMGKDGVPMVPRGFPFQNQVDSGEVDQKKAQRQQDMTVKKAGQIADLRKQKLDMLIKLQGQMIDDPDTGTKKPRYSDDEARRLVDEYFGQAEQEIIDAYATGIPSGPPAGYDMRSEPSTAAMNQGGSVTLPQKPTPAQQMNNRKAYDTFVSGYGKQGAAKQRELRKFLKGRAESGDADAEQAYQQIRTIESKSLPKKLEALTNRIKEARGKSPGEYRRARQELMELREMFPEFFQE